VEEEEGAEGEEEGVEGKGDHVKGGDSVSFIVNLGHQLWVRLELPIKVDINLKAGPGLS
jgi:hypothetical protein